MIINYRFRNALYYKFGNTITLEKNIKIFDLKNTDKEIDFVVYGLFESKKYKLKCTPQLSLENTSFKTTFSNLNFKLEERIIPKLIHSQIQCDIKTPIVVLPNIRIKNQNIKISTTTFNQNEFI